MMSAAQVFLQNDKIPIPLEGKMALLVAFFVVQGTLVGTTLEINGLTGTLEATLNSYILKLIGGSTIENKYLPVTFFSPHLKTCYDPKLIELLIPLLLIKSKPILPTAAVLKAVIMGASIVATT